VREHDPPRVSYALGAHHPELLLERPYDRVASNGVCSAIVAAVAELAA
jgi:hypothetical protein